MKERINNYESIDMNKVYQKYIQRDAIIILIVALSTVCILYYFDNAYIKIM